MSSGLLSVNCARGIQNGEQLVKKEHQKLSVLWFASLLLRSVFGATAPKAILRVLHDHTVTVVYVAPHILTQEHWRQEEYSSIRSSYMLSCISIFYHSITFTGTYDERKIGQWSELEPSPSPRSARRSIPHQGACLHASNPLYEEFQSPL